MNQEKFVNQYIELLNATVAESIQKNLILQTQKKIVETENNEFREELKIIRVNKDHEIESLKAQLNQSKKQEAIIGNEKEELRKSIQHVDTFKNELIKTRTEIERLEALIIEKDKLIKKLSPTVKKVEIKEEKKVEEKIEEKPKDVGNTWVKKIPAKRKTVTKEIIKDAGKF